MFSYVNLDQRVPTDHPLRAIRKMADLILDTSQYNSHQLREYIKDHYDLRRSGSSMIVSVTSFGYKFGVPTDVDVVLDTAMRLVLRASSGRCVNTIVVRPRINSS